LFGGLIGGAAGLVGGAVFGGAFRDVGLLRASFLGGTAAGAIGTTLAGGNPLLGAFEGGVLGLVGGVLGYGGEIVRFPRFEIAEAPPVFRGRPPARVVPGDSPIPNIAPEINRDVQARHTLAMREWIERGQGGYVTDIAEAQAVLDAAHAGEAQILGITRDGHIVVRYNGVIGYNQNPAKGYVHQPTNVFIIKGTANPSVVPTSPFWRPKY
jgi:hypothetical protein